MPPSSRLILLVEDEHLIRWTARDALEMEGYEVVDAENALQALEVLTARSDVGLLFTDVNMPGPMDGLSLAEMVHAKWPAIRIVVTSGRALERKVPDDGAYLRKPYSLEDLFTALSGVASGR